MKNKNVILYLLFFLLAGPIKGQGLTQLVKGTVKEAGTGNGISFATVVLQGSEPILGTTADFDGNFTLENVPIGRHSFVFSAMGYEEQIVTDVLVGSAKVSQLHVVLQEKLNETDVVKVTAKTRKDQPLNTMTTASGRMFSVEEAKKYAGGFDDPARLASSFAGVSSSGTGNNGIVIRGNSPKGLLWRLEGVEISNPNHFADLDAFGGGGLTALSTFVLANSDFFTGAFPAEYGNAYSGVFDLKLRTGNNEDREYAFEIGAIGTDFAAEGPFKKGGKSTYIFNYRYSTLGLIAPLLPDGVGGIGYQDLSFKLFFPTKKYGEFALWGLGALDKSGRKPVEDSLEIVTYYDLIDGNVTQSMGAIGLSHDIKLSKKMSLNSTLSASGNGMDLEYDRMDFSSKSLLPTERINTGFWNYVMQTNANTKFNAKHTNKTGFSATIMNYNVSIKNGTVNPGTLVTVANQKGNATFLRAYSNSKYRFSSTFFATLGVNYQMFLLNNHSVLEPRVGFKWSMTKKSKLGFAYGKHSRLERLNMYLNTVPTASGNYAPNQDLDLNKAHHFVLSLERRITKNLKISFEPFYQYLYDVPVIANSSYSLINLQSDFYFNDTLQNTGKGVNYGLDITLEKYLTKGMYYMVTASLFKSEYTGGDGVWRNTRFNRQFVSNFLVGKEWSVGKGKNNLFGVNLRATYQGGVWFTPVDGAATQMEKEIVEDNSNPFSLQRDPTLTMHSTITYRRNKEKHASIWSLRLLNFTGTEDFYGYEYNLKTNEAQFSTDALFIPNISYKIEF